NQNEALTILVEPNDYLHVNVEASRNTDQTEVTFGTRRTDTLRGYVDARPYRSVQVIFDAGVARQRFEAFPGSSDRKFYDLTAYLQLTDELRLQLQGNLDSVDVSGSPPAQLGFLSHRGKRGYGEFYYRTGPMLALSVRYGYASIDRQNSTLQ